MNLSDHDIDDLAGYGDLLDDGLTLDLLSTDGGSLLRSKIIDLRVTEGTGPCYTA